eukprot:16445772-Heterocapsa_arctica.AAC.2
MSRSVTLRRLQASALRVDGTAPADEGRAVLIRDLGVPHGSEHKWGMRSHRACSIGLASTGAWSGRSLRGFRVAASPHPLQTNQHCVKVERPGAPRIPPLDAGIMREQASQ